jgi:hypothetical protein
MVASSVVENPIGSPQPWVMRFAPPSMNAPAPAVPNFS